MSSHSWKHRLSEVSKRSGFSKWYDFSYKPNLAEKIENIIVILIVNFMCFVAAFLLLKNLAAIDYLTTQSEWIKQPFIQSGIGSGIAAKLSNLFQSQSKYLLFFLMCILAPLWEELVFRVTPIKIARHLKLHGKASEAILKQPHSNSHIILVVILSSSIIFGFGHGDIVNILFQGVSGLCMSYVYIKNGDSYWSAVTYHSLWNGMVAFVIPWLMTGHVI